MKKMLNNIYEREKLMQKRANLCRLQQQGLGMVLKFLKAVAGWRVIREHRG